MTDDIMVREVLKILQLATDEGTKIIAPAAVGATLAGAHNLRQLLVGRIKTLPKDPEAAAAKIVKMAGSDPDFRRRLYVAVAELRLQGLDVVVPEAPPGFTDRGDILTGLGTPGKWLITGREGFGKTSVVKKVRHDRAEEYPDGNVYIDCNAFRTDGALRYAEIYSDVLHQVGVEVIETSDAALSLQYRSALLHGRFLLVFDNVDSVSEAEALVRDWPLSLVLVTTRDGFGELVAWCPTEPVRLGGLDKAGGRAVLEASGRNDLLDAEPEAAEQLLDLCDYIPAFLRQAGHTLSLRRGERRPVARLVAELREGRDPNGFGGVLTSLSLRSLPELVYADLALLGAHPGATFTRDSAEALLGRPAPATIDILLASGLVIDDSDGRLRLLRLVRQRVAAPPLAVQAALRRLLDVVCADAMAADATLEGPRLRPMAIPSDRPWRLSYLTPVEYLDAQAPLIVDLVQLAHHWKLHEYAVQLCGALEVVLTYEGRHHLVATAITWGIKSAEALRDDAATARLYATRARIETDLGLFDEGEASLDTAQLISRGVDNPRLESSLCEFRSRLARERARHAVDTGKPVTPEIFAEAVDWIRRALMIDREHDGLSRGRGIHSRELGNLLVRAGHPDEALRCFEEAARHTDATRPRNVSRIHLGRARAFDLRQRWTDVDREVAQVRALLAASGASAYDIELDDFLAETAWHRGDFETARAGWKQLAARFLTMAHPRADRYLDKLNQPTPPRQ